MANDPSTRTTKSTPLQLAPPFVLLVGVVISLFGWQALEEVYSTRSNEEFQYDANARFRHVESRVHQVGDAVHATRGLFRASSHVGREEFRLFSEVLLSRHEGMQALEWAPLVTNDNRVSHEAAVGLEWKHHYRISERNSKLQLRTASARDCYFPVCYVEPLTGNESAVGYDLLSEPDRRQTIQRAISTGNLQISAPLTLAQDVGGEQHGILACLPFYRADAPQGPSTTGDSMARTSGVVVGVFRIDDLLRGVVHDDRNGTMNADLELQLVDITNASEPIAFYRSSDCDTSATSPLVSSRVMEIGGRRWKMTVAAGPNYEHARPTWTPLLVMAGGIAMSILSCFFTSMLVSRHNVIKQTIAKRTQELLKAKKHLAMALSAGNAGIWDFHLVDGTACCDEQWYRMLGYQPHDFEMSLGQFEAMLHPEDRTRVMSILKESADNGLESFVAEFRLCAKDRQWRWVCSRGEAIEWKSNGIATRAIGVNFDIDESKRVQEELAEARKAAEQANQAKSAFLANMSHEIRTPMNAVVGYTELLEQGLRENEKRERLLEHTQSIISNGNHLVQIINDILDISKVEAGKLETELVACDPHLMVAEAIDMAGGHAKGRNVDLSAEIDDQVPHAIMSSPIQIRQILIKLLSNAIKFTPAGKVSLHVRTVHSYALGNTLEFEVADTGIGISSSQMERLFEPFTQGDSSTTRRFGGTGLGLAICRRFAQALGGTIRVSSTAGVGSRFTLTLPLQASEEVIDEREPREIAAVEHDTNAAKSLVGCRVLLAEDGVDNQRLISAHLKRAKADVTVVENGQLAVNEAFANIECGTPFDVILMDMQMPVLDGYAAAQKLRDNGYTGPIVALTAHAMLGDRERCLAAGCNDYASKPIRREALLATVGRHFKPTVVESAS